MEEEGESTDNPQRPEIRLVWKKDAKAPQINRLSSLPYRLINRKEPNRGATDVDVEIMPECCLKHREIDLESHRKRGGGG